MTKDSDRYEFLLAEFKVHNLLPEGITELNNLKSKLHFTASESKK